MKKNIDMETIEEMMYILGNENENEMDGKRLSCKKPSINSHSLSSFYSQCNSNKPIKNTLDCYYYYIMYKTIYKIVYINYKPDTKENIFMIDGIDINFLLDSKNLKLKDNLYSYFLPYGLAKKITKIFIPNKKQLKNYLLALKNRDNDCFFLSNNYKFLCYQRSNNIKFPENNYLFKENNYFYDFVNYDLEDCKDDIVNNRYNNITTCVFFTTKVK